MPNTKNNWSAWFSIVDFINRDASPTPMTDAMVVFLDNAIKVLPNGTIDARNAWGKRWQRSFVQRTAPVIGRPPLVQRALC